MMISEYLDSTGKKLIYTKCRRCGENISPEYKSNFLYAICSGCNKEINVLPVKGIAESYEDCKCLTAKL